MEIIEVYASNITAIKSSVYSTSLPPRSGLYLSHLKLLVDSV